MKIIPLIKNVGKVSFLAALLSTAPLRADVTLASPFTSHMVLQREMKVPVWGTADAGEDVTVKFAGQQKTAKADAAGKWRVDLDSLTASADGRAFTVSGSKTPNPVVLDDVLVGEVWLASGQSNMVFPVQQSGPYGGIVEQATEIPSANYPLIRMFTGPDTKAYEPSAAINASWIVCSPDTVGRFSAVGYLFARDLQKYIKVPVGILTLASGASCAEAWISRDSLAADPQTKPMLDAFDAGYKLYHSGPEGQAAEALARPTPINKARVPRPSAPERDQHMPTVLFNAMINPVVPYAIRGAIWYQGESIVGGTPGLNLYGHMLGLLIKDWRTKWSEGDFPFYVVQLPGQENISNNPRIREEQQSILALPNTGMVVTMDTGEARNVHPVNKSPVGDRLMRVALANVYGVKFEFYGPMYQSMKVEGNTARIQFTHTGGGLTAVRGPLKGFQIAGADQKFVDAEAKIDGDALIVSSPQVAAPVAVRYAWMNYPEGAGSNLYNGAGLPAAPFRTDKWEYPIAGIVEN